MVHMTSAGYSNNTVTKSRVYAKGGVGVKTPLFELDILQKLYYLRKAD